MSVTWGVQVASDAWRRQTNSLAAIRTRADGPMTDLAQAHQDRAVLIALVDTEAVKARSRAEEFVAQVRECGGPQADLDDLARAEGWLLAIAHALDLPDANDPPLILNALLRRLDSSTAPSGEVDR